MYPLYLFEIPEHNRSGILLCLFTKKKKSPRAPALTKPLPTTHI